MTVTKTKRFPSTKVKSAQLKGSIPETEIPEDADCIAIASECLKTLGDLGEENLTPDAFWKDNLCLTGTLRTLYSANHIIATWKHVFADRKPHSFKLLPHACHVFPLGPRRPWISAGFAFETEGKQASYCSGSLNIVLTESGHYKIWVLSTVLEELKGLGNPDNLKTEPVTAAQDVSNGVEATYYDCVVVGAGMAGLCASSHLQALGISYVAIDRNERLGDNWDKRYESVKLHLSKYFSEMPQRMYNDKPYYLSGKVMAQGLRDFADIYHLNVWMSTSVVESSWDEESSMWLLRISRNGEVLTVKARHLIMALGNGFSRVNMPEYADREKYKGDVIHSAWWKDGKPWTGKKGIIIGSANSAFDIAEDMAHAPLAGITMVQRSETMVIPQDYVKLFTDPIYNDQLPLAVADRLTQCSPYPVGRLMAIATLTPLLPDQEKRYEALRAAGFRMRLSPDMYENVVDRGGGHHLDVGGSELITSGKMKVKSDSLPVAYTETGLRFADGTTIDADVIAFCTGFTFDMKGDVAEILGHDITDDLEEFYFLRGEGDIRGMAVPIGRKGLWYHGGGTQQARFMSRFTALQIKADLAGVPFEPYEE